MVHAARASTSVRSAAAMDSTSPSCVATLGKRRRRRPSRRRRRRPRRFASLPPRRFASHPRRSAGYRVGTSDTPRRGAARVVVVVGVVDVVRERPSDRRPFLSTVFISGVAVFATRALTSRRVRRPRRAVVATSPAWHSSRADASFRVLRAPIFAPAGSREALGSRQRRARGRLRRVARARGHVLPTRRREPAREGLVRVLHARLEGAHEGVAAQTAAAEEGVAEDVRFRVFFPRRARRRNAAAACCARVFFLTRSSRLTSTTSGKAVAP